jgi:hypothetical protein
MNCEHYAPEFITARGNEPTCPHCKLAEETERGDYWLEQFYACDDERKRLQALLGRVVGTPLTGRTMDGGTFISGELLRDIEAGLGTRTTVREDVTP